MIRRIVTDVSVKSSKNIRDQKACEDPRGGREAVAPLGLREHDEGEENLRRHDFHGIGHHLEHMLQFGFREAQRTQVLGIEVCDLLL